MWYVMLHTVQLKDSIFYAITQTKPEEGCLLEFDAKGDNPLFAAATAIAVAGMETKGINIKYAD